MKLNVVYHKSASQESQISLDVESTATVSEVKKLLEQKEEIPSGSQRLFLLGEPETLTDERTLASYELDETKPVHMFESLRSEPVDPELQGATDYQVTLKYQTGVYSRLHKRVKDKAIYNDGNVKIDVPSTQTVREVG